MSRIDWLQHSAGKCQGIDLDDNGHGSYSKNLFFDEDIDRCKVNAIYVTPIYMICYVIPIFMICLYVIPMYMICYIYHRPQCIMHILVYLPALRAWIRHPNHYLCIRLPLGRRIVGCEAQ